MDLTSQYEVLKPLSHERVLCIPLASSQEKGIVGILTLADGENKTDKLAILTHGSGGHKNYTFLKKTAHELAEKNGINLFRFDFRGCGDSIDHMEDVRDIEFDIMDLDTVVKFFSKKITTKKLFNLDFEIDAIIAHSRGTTAMFKWSILQWRKHSKGADDAFLIKNLVNVSGRFTGKDILSWAKSNIPQWPDVEGHEVSIYKDKRFNQKLLIPKEETLMISRQSYTGDWDLLILNNSKFYKTLTIFGEKDDKIEIDDANKFNRALQKINKLIFIKDADHNFYGIEKFTKEDAAKLGLPLSARGLINYNVLVSNEISKFLAS